MKLYKEGDYIRIKSEELIFASLNVNGYNKQSANGIAWNESGMKHLFNNEYRINSIWEHQHYMIDDGVDTWAISSEWIVEVQPVKLPEELFKI